MKKFFSILVLIALIVSLCSTSLAQTQPSIAGDLTADGKVTLADVLVTARYCIGSTTPSAQEILTADINATGNIELADVLLCARMAIGQMTPETADIYVVGPVSYTHLDVYKRQSQACIKLFIRFLISVNTAHSLPVNFNKIRLFIKSS